MRDTTADKFAAAIERLLRRNGWSVTPTEEPGGSFRKAEERDDPNERFDGCRESDWFVMLKMGCDRSAEVRGEQQQAQDARARNDEEYCGDKFNQAADASRASGAGDR